MENQNIKLNKEITVSKNSKALISFYDNLKVSSLEHYPRLHANKEKDNQSEYKQTSLIDIIMQDYSKGTGEKNIIVKYQMLPEEIQYIYSRIEIGHKTFSHSALKIFGTDNKYPDYSYVTKISITRTPYDYKNTEMRYPWNITIENGRGIKEISLIGGVKCKSNSYICEKSVSLNLSDLDFFIQFKRVDRYIKTWENIMGRNLVLKALNLHQS